MKAIEPVFTAKAMGLLDLPDAEVHVWWNNARESYDHCRLIDLRRHVEDDKNEWNSIKVAKINGVETGVFCVLTARSRRAARLMTEVTGITILKGDGKSCGNQSMARRLSEELLAQGVTKKELRMRWMVGSKPKRTYKASLEAPAAEPKSYGLIIRDGDLSVASTQETLPF